MNWESILVIAAVYLAYRVGRWSERVEAQSRSNGERAAALYDLYDSAVRNSTVNRPADNDTPG